MYACTKYPRLRGDILITKGNGPLNMDGVERPREAILSNARRRIGADICKWVMLGAKRASPRCTRRRFELRVLHQKSDPRGIVDCKGDAVTTRIDRRTVCQAAWSRSRGLRPHRQHHRCSACECEYCESAAHHHVVRQHDGRKPSDDIPCCVSADE